MYIFVTYGTKGWRGVQERGLAIADYFKKNEVLFLNGYDSEFIKKRGFKCKTIDLSLEDPRRIKFPKNTKAIVFADLPTNELFNLSLFFAAKKKKVPVVICDQIYRRGQTKEGVYRNLIEFSELFLLNGLSFFKNEETRKIKIVPPLPEYSPSLNIKADLARKYNLDSKKIWIFVSGYFEPVYKMTKKIYPLLLKKKLNFYFIICGLSIKKPQKRKNQLLLPYLPQNEFLQFLDAADLFISKFGYLQILEALALKTPLIVAGKAGFVLKMEILDKKLRKVIKYVQNEKELLSEILSIIDSPSKRKKLLKEISKLHNGEMNGARVAAEYIKKVSLSTLPSFKRKIFILTNKEFKQAENLILNEKYLYPLVLILPVSKPGPKLHPVKRPDEDCLSLQLQEFFFQQNEILPHHFWHIFLFSRRKYDGFVNIFPWYQAWINQLTFLLRESDEIWVTPKAKYLIANLLKPFKKKVRVKRI